MIIHALHGLVVPYIRDGLRDDGIPQDKIKEYMADLVINGIKS